MDPATPRPRVLEIARAVLVAALAAGALLALSLGPASAAPAGADPTPTATATPSPGKAAQAIPQRLERLFQQEQKALERQQKQLTRAGDMLARIQARIDAAKAKGQNTAEQEAALAALKTAIAAARASHDSARATLDAHAGFGADGKVTDAAQARATLETAQKALRQAEQTLHAANADYQKALRLTVLERQFQQERQELGTLQKRLAQAGEMAIRAQTRIDEEKGKGRDTTKLEAALSGFKTSVASAQSNYDSARSTLDAHAGFGADGKVADAAQARTTVDTAGKAMRQAARTLRKALADLQKATREYTQANRPRV